MGVLSKGDERETTHFWGERPGMGPGVVKASVLGLAGHLTFTMTGPSVFGVPDVQ